jgi:dolichol-phosphate mannosyltransferase
MKITIIIPTYNEAENIGRLIPILAQEFTKAPQHQFTVLVVDANSPDGTAQKVTELAAQYPFVQLLIENQKNGLGAAYIFAFKHVMANIPSDAVIEMDADFQHRPQDLLKLVEKAEQGFDYVIGSRFIQGGSIPQDWKLYRRLISKGGNIFSSLVLGIRGVHDYTSGFKLTRVKGVLDKMDLDKVMSQGFAYKMDLLYKAKKLGAKIGEVPIEFGLRDRGDSKMERNNLIDSLKVVIMLRVMEHPSFVKFGIVGMGGLLTDVVLFNSLRLFMASGYASAIAGLFAMMVTYTLNNFWSFKHQKKDSKWLFMRDFPIYAISSYVPIIFRSFLVGWSEDMFGKTFIVDNLAFFIGISFGLIWNYTVYSRLIWRKKSP